MTSTTSASQRAKKRRDWKPAFLKALETEGTVWAAATAAGIDRGTAYKARQRDEAFAVAWADAEERTTDQLERKAVEVALGGDTRMLEFLLKARRPERYTERRKVEHSGKVDSEVTLSAPDDEARALAVARMLRDSGALGDEA